MKLHVAEYFFKSMQLITLNLLMERNPIDNLPVCLAINNACTTLHELIKSDEEMMALVKEMEGK